METEPDSLWFQHQIC